MALFFRNKAKMKSMKILHIIIFFGISLSCHAQKVDSLKFYRQEILKVNQKITDSLFNNESYANLIKQYERLAANRHVTISFDQHVELVQNDYDALNLFLRKNNLKSFYSNTMRIAIGMTFQQKRNFIGLKVISVSSSQKRYSGLYSIDLNQMDLLEISYGRAILYEPKAILYPYFGTSTRINYIKFFDPSNSRTDNFADTMHFNVLLGCAFDYKLFNQTQIGKPVHVFIKCHGLFPLTKNRNTLSSYGVFPINTASGRFVASSGIRILFN